ncbi:MAG: hypothetical protein CSB33_04140 [Desulfobacterales bacterium]|nr:MAG: hypothetical protein CSB33_04140 [Desulfobacterales bacterium]
MNCFGRNQMTAAGNGFRQKIVSALMTAALFALCSCGGGDSSDGTQSSDTGSGNDAGVAATRTLKSFASRDELGDYLKSGLKSTADKQGGWRKNTMGETSDLADAGAGSVSAPSVSGTNLQEKGVDEADLVKTDGDILYIAPPDRSFPYDNIAGGKDVRSVPPALTAVSTTAAAIDPGAIPPGLDKEPVDGLSGSLIARYESDPEPGKAIRVMRLSDDPAGAAELARISVDHLKNSISGMYLLTDRDDGEHDLLVTVGGGGMDIRGMWYCPSCWTDASVEIALFDVENPESAERLDRIEIEGSLISSRRVDEMLYLVTRYTPQPADWNPYAGDDPKEIARNEQVLAATAPEDLLPDVRINGEPAGDLVDPTDCFLPDYEVDRKPDPTLLTVTAIDLVHLSRRISRTVTGSCDTVYMSTGGLWLATTSYDYMRGPFLKLMDAEDSTDAAAADSIAPPPVTTDIHYFALTANGPEYLASGTVEGHLGWEADKRSFRFSEYDGSLRVAMSLGDSWNNTATTRMTILQDQGDGALAEVGHVDNIGEEGENLYSVRYTGDRAYLVTFRVTDPLYVFDLSDPAAPRILGELHIPGYSDYLHPVSADLVLGIGKDAVPDTTSSDFGGGRGAWYQGMKLSLFDVSDPAAPAEVNHIIIGKRGTDSDALWNHHALAWLPDADGEGGRLALPIRLHDRTMDGKHWDEGEPFARYAWTHTGLYLFDIDRSGIGRPERMIVEKAEENDYDWSDGNDRAVLLNGSAHYIHQGQVWSAAWDAPSAVSGPK